MTRCNLFYDKWNRDAEWCEKCPSSVSNIENYLDLLDEFEQKGIPKNFTKVKLPEATARPLFRLKDPIHRDKAISTVALALNNNKDTTGRFFKRLSAGDINKIVFESSPTFIKTLEAAKDPLPTNIELFEGDCFDQFRKIPDKSIDLFLTDPPYSVMEDVEWDHKDDQFYHNWLKIIKQKLKDQFTGFIFCDARKQYEFETILRNYFEVKNRLIWIRKNMSMGRVIKDQFISSHEVIFYFGTRPLNLPVEWGSERFDTCEFAVPQSNFNGGKLHPTQKPLELISRLIKIGSYTGDTILDCFAGSGTTGVACKQLGDRNCLLIEKEPEYATIARGAINVR